MPASGAKTNKHNVTTIFTANMIVTPGNSSNMRIYLERSGGAGGSASDTYETNKADGQIEANILLSHFDVHYYRNRIGSPAELTG